jgi:tetratricopeptide (TPR) repeat protein
VAFCRTWLKEAGDNPEMINAVAWTCHENKILLEEAVEWARRLVVEIDREETTAYMDTYAWLLFDNGDPERAAEWEEKALFAAESNSENETYAEALKTFREAAEKKDN